ncbi:MAG: sigma-70 family RNA polymerase sigma factor [Clostridia bacterium]
MTARSQRTAAEIEAFIHRHSALVYRVAYARTNQKADADDVFQEVFLRYAAKLPTFESEEHQRAWLIRVTLNCASKHYASFWNRKTTALPEDFAFAQPEESGLAEALRQLPAKDRALVHLFYYEGYSTDEIAKLLRTKTSTVRTRLTRARAKLKVLLKGDYDVENPLSADD